MNQSEVSLMLEPSVIRRIRFIDHDGRAGLPWVPFIEIFGKAGFEFLDSSDEESEFEFLISCRHSNAMVRECEMWGVNPNRRALIVLEPECVDPLPYLSQIQNKYGNLYSGSESWAAQLGGKTFRYFNGALSLLDDSARPDLLDTQLRANKFVMIQAHKFSIIRGEQYSLRREVAQEAWRSEVSLELYGRSWLMGNSKVLLSVLKSIYSGLWYAMKAKQPSVLKLRGLSKIWLKSGIHYKGEPEDQIEVLKNYRYAIVIENSLDFVSEKLFNAMAAGCRVIYVGESLANYGNTPSSVVIVKPNHKLIVEAMSRMLKDTNNKDFHPSRIREEARILFTASDSTKVQNLLADMIIKQFNSHTKAD